MFLVSSIIGLLIGPLIYLLAQSRRYLLQVIDGFVFVSVGGLVLMHLVHSLETANTIIVLALGLLGFLGPNILERTFHKSGHSIHLGVLVLGLLGLVLHATIDGAALLTEAHELPLAIILHRLPVGLTVWWLLRPKYSSPVCWSLLVVMSLATIAGFMLGETLLAPAVNTPLDYVQSFVAGSILHVVFFRLHFQDEHGEVHDCCSHSHGSSTLKIGQKSKAPTLVKSWPESIGNLLGILLLVIFLVSFPQEGHQHGSAVSHGPHEHNGTSFSQTFLSLALQTAPALLIAYLSAILLYGFLPQASIRWMGRGSSLSQAIRGMAAGLPLPMCSCGVLPFYRTIMHKGATPASAIAFLVATPELGLDALLISLPLLGPQFTLVRVIAAALLAVVVSVVVSRGVSTIVSANTAQEKTDSARKKLIKGTRYALLDLVDSTGPWILAGLLLAAFAEPVIAEVPLSLPYHLEIFLFALVGVVVYVCASGATPLVAVLIAGGVSPGAGLAFLLTGPATNISTFGVLSELHDRRFALAFAASTTLCAVILGYTVDILIPNMALTSAESLTMHHGSPWEQFSLVLVLLLVTFSVIRKGGRGFLGEIFGREITVS